MKTIVINNKSFFHESPYNLLIQCIAFLITEINKTNNILEHNFVKRKNGRDLDLNDPKLKFNGERAEWSNNVYTARQKMYKLIGLKTLTRTELVNLVEDKFKVTHKCAERWVADYTDPERKWVTFVDIGYKKYMFNITLLNNWDWINPKLTIKLKKEQRKQIQERLNKN